MLPLVDSYASHLGVKGILVLYIAAPIRKRLQMPHCDAIDLALGLNFSTHPRLDVCFDIQYLRHS